VHADLAFEVGPVILRPRAAAGWGEHLPLGAQLIMGGAEGFPGLRTGERRGDQLVFGSLTMLREIAGPIYARVEVGAGRTSFARDRVTGAVPDVARGFVRGIEVGLATDTPLGPFVIGYGISSTERSVFKIRLGS
jgi:hypothetical protein